MLPFPLLNLKAKFYFDCSLVQKARFRSFRPFWTHLAQFDRQGSVIQVSSPAGTTSVEVQSAPTQGVFALDLWVLETI